MIGAILGIADKILAHWTPEKIRARARLKLKKLQKEKNALLKEPPNLKNSNRMCDLLHHIEFLQNYLQEG